jgi:hypothetical protein
VLSQFAHAAETPNPEAVSVFVEDRITGVTVNSEGDLDFSNAKLGIDGRDFNERDYLVKGAPRTIEDPAPAETRAPHEWRQVDSTDPDIPLTVYYVSYRYVNDLDNDNVVDVNERMQGVVDEPLILPNPTGDPTGSMPRVLSGRTAADRIVIAGEIGVRVKRLLRTAIVNSNREMSERDSIRGYVEFANATNSIPDDLQAPGSTDFIYPTVSLNYTARDWRWLIDDDTPQANTNILHTSIRFYDDERLAETSLDLEEENRTKPFLACFSV